MTARTYSRFNGSAIGASLELLEAGRIVTTDASALSVDRSVLSTLAQSEFDSFAEFIVYGSVADLIADDHPRHLRRRPARRLARAGSRRHGAGVIA